MQRFVIRLLALGASAAIAMGATVGAPSDRAFGEPLESANELPVIVRESMPATSNAERLVERLGGRVDRQLPIVDGFSATIPSNAVEDLARSDHVVELLPDDRVEMAGLLDDISLDDISIDDDDDDLPDLTEYDELAPDVVWRNAIGLDALDGRYTGAGVTVALLDTGVSRVDDLGDRVLARVDLTTDADGYDRYGHGTHMAGLIAGDGTASGGRWAGVAPEANIVSVKVARWEGATDVSVVIAGLQWIVANRDRYDIRVVNLSFGTDARQSYLLDPLDDAVEAAWEAGILVVVSAGNRGPDPGSISKPGDDPFVVTVGAADLGNTTTTADDRAAEFSARGPTPEGHSKPDIVAPGISLVSNRAAGSTIDAYRPTARVDAAYFKGTGTSQSAAIVSGLAALLYEADDDLTPDVAKAILMGTATQFADPAGAGNGLVDALAALTAVETETYEDAPANQGFPRSAGMGHLELSRGSHHVVADIDGDGQPERLGGELDALGLPWSAPDWTIDGWPASAWQPLAIENIGWENKSWRGATWTGVAWDNKSWSAGSWSAVPGWDQKSWSAITWN